MTEARSLGDILRQLVGPPREEGAPGPAGEDEEEQAPECSVCGGIGWVSREVSVDHPDFGCAFPCRCAREERGARQTERLLRYSNLGPLASRRFACLDPRGRVKTGPGQFEAALRAAEAFAAQPEGVLVIHGPIGSGKTHLAAAIANRVIEDGRPALFVYVPDLLDHLRAAYRPEQDVSYDELFEQVRNAPVLVLDDLGAQSPTPWAQEKLSQLLNHRRAGGLPTMITVDGEFDVLPRELQGRLDDRESVRICALGERAHLSGLGILDAALLADKTFTTFEPARPELIPRQRKRLIELAQSVADYAEDPRGWLVLLGPRGTGKTHLAAGIMNYRLVEGGAVLFTVVPDLLDHFRSAYSPDSKISYDVLFEAVRSAPLLILDDLGTQSASPWANEKLYQLMNHRYNAKLPTVVTTAVPIEDIDERLRTRLLDPGLCQLLVIDAHPFRGVATMPRVRPPRPPVPGAGSGGDPRLPAAPGPMPRRDPASG